MATLRTAAMGAIRGCDYGKYLALADSLASAMATFRSLDAPAPGKSWAVPFLDPLTMLFHAGSLVAAKQSAQANHDGLAYQLEQVCNAVVQSDQGRRQTQLLQVLSTNIGVNLSWLLGGARRSTATVPGANYATVQASWANNYTAAAPITHSPLDTLWQAVDTTLKTTLSASAAMNTALDSIAGQLRITEQEMLLFAEPDSTDPTSLSCPTGYPDPNRPDADVVGGKVVCGPATPERQAQVVAHLELLKTQIRALQLTADSRSLEVESVGLMSDNEGRRITELNRNASALRF
jgi:hypothetical protein